MRLSVRRRDGHAQLNLGPEGWTEAAAALYRDEHCDGVFLDSTRPYDDLDFLRPLPGLRVLTMGASKIKDMSAVFDKTELEDLGGGLNIRDLRGLSRLTRLRLLAVPYRKGIEEVAQLTGLEILHIEEWPKGTDLGLLGPKPRLRELFLSLKRTAEISSAWFPSAPGLIDLALYFGRLTDTAGLAALTSLERLRFADTKVTDLDFTAAMPHLKSLELDNAGEVRGPLPGGGVDVQVFGRTHISP